MKTKAGMLIFILGICTADSEWLIVPISLVALGMWLMKGMAHGQD